jgi:thioredoxin reductase (NADPH)
MNDRPAPPLWEVAVVGGGIAGLSAAVYLGRSRRRTIVLDHGHSMAKWEEMVENYLGFPEGLSGTALLERSRRHAEQFGAVLTDDEVTAIRREGDGPFLLQGRTQAYRARRVLLATGLTHVLPDIPGAGECLGKSVFFCKDCDGYRVQGRRIVIVGSREEAARYALAMLAFSPSVQIATHGERPGWAAPWEDRLAEYGVPVTCERIAALQHEGGAVRLVRFESGEERPIEALFATRGDRYHTWLAEGLGAKEDDQGQLLVDGEMRTSVEGLYAAGCVTPANCQMIIAAGQGATAAQAVNRDLFEENLARHALRVCAPVW